MVALNKFFLGGLRLIAIFGLIIVAFMTIKIAGQLGFDAAFGYIVSIFPTLCLDLGVLFLVWYIRRELAKKVRV